jgi:hypothetical protein
MRHGQRVFPRREEEEAVHTVTVGFGSLDRSFGYVSQFHNGVGNHRLARIAHHAGQTT